MLRLGIIARGKCCFFTLMLILGSVVWGGVARGALPLDSGLARQAYSVAERWVTGPGVPEKSPLEGLMMVTDLAAVHATIRLDGVMLGHATSVTREPGAAGDAVETDLLVPVAQSVRAALKNSAGQLALNALVEARGRLCLDLQFAFTPEKLRLENLQALPGLVDPGRVGLTMTFGKRNAWLFPGNIIAGNIKLTSQLTRLLGELGLPIDRQNQIAQPGGPELYRFEAIHLVKPKVGQEVVELTRGGIPLAPMAITEWRISAMIDTYVGMLSSRQGETGLYAGSFNPTSSQYIPQIASLYEMAVANFALARVSKLPSIKPATREQALAAAQLGVKAMLELREQMNPQQYKLASTAMCVLALLETPGVAEHQEMLGRMTRDLLFMRHEEIGLFRSGFSATSSTASIPYQAMAAAALVQWFKMNRDPATEQASSATLNALWAQIDDPLDVSRALPWLAYAELGLTDMGVINPRLTKLNEACEQVLNKQIGSDDPNASPDTIGGLEVGLDLFGAPSWRTAQILAGLCRGMASDQLVGEEATPRWLFGCGLAGRFIDQLTMREHDCYYTMSPDHAIGAVRYALHNNRQPLEATATALLAMVEFQGALDRLMGVGGK